MAEDVDDRGVVQTVGDATFARLAESGRADAGTGRDSFRSTTMRSTRGRCLRATGTPSLSKVVPIVPVPGAPNNRTPHLSRTLISLSWRAMITRTKPTLLDERQTLRARLLASTDRHVMPTEGDYLPELHFKVMPTLTLRQLIKTRPPGPKHETAGRALSSWRPLSARSSGQARQCFGDFTGRDANLSTRARCGVRGDT
jgi:hypothetical protein